MCQELLFFLFGFFWFVPESGFVLVRSTIALRVPKLRYELRDQLNASDWHLCGPDPSCPRRLIRDRERFLLINDRKGNFSAGVHKKQGRRQRGSTYVQERLSHLKWKDFRRVETIAISTVCFPEYVAFYSTQCCSRVLQIFFQLLFCIWTTWRRKHHH